MVTLKPPPVAETAAPPREHSRDPLTPAEALAEAGLHNRITEAYAERRGLAPEALARQLADRREPAASERLPGFGAARDRLRTAVPAHGPARVHIRADCDADGVVSGLLMREAVLARNPEARVSVDLAPRAGTGSRWLDATNVGSLSRDLNLLIVADQRPQAVPGDVPVLSVDHHAAPPAPLAGETVFNPRTEGTRAPGTELSAAGLAWHMARAEGADGARLAPLAIVGLIGDRSAMTGDVRALTRLAVGHVRDTHYTKLDPRLRGLVSETSGVSYKHFSELACAFYLAPLLNAALRRNDSSPLAWLAAVDWESASRAAGGMAEQLARQKDLVGRSDAQVRGNLGEPGASPDPPLVRVVEFDDLEGYHGLVASRVAERYNCLAVVGDGTRFSARRPESLSDIDLAAWLELPLVRDRLGAAGGGHAGACGFTLRAPRDPQHMAEVLNLLAAARGVRRRPPEALPAALAELTPDTVDQIRGLAPFGEGWPVPQLEVEFMLDRDGTRVLGNAGLHMQYGVRDPDGGPAWRAVQFNCKDPDGPMPFARAMEDGPVPVRAVCELDDRRERSLVLRSLTPLDPATAAAHAAPVMTGVA